MSSSTEILFNSPALHSLKRSQLIKLCKKHGVKASGKNADMVARLQEYALTMPTMEPTFVIPTSDAAIDEAEVEGHDEYDDDDMTGQTPRGPMSLRTSEPWSMIEGDSREEENIHPLLARKRSMKSTHSTSTVEEFGSQGSGVSSKSSSVTSSLKAFASSLGLSRHLSIKSKASVNTISSKAPAIQPVQIQPVQPQSKPEPESDEDLEVPAPEPNTYCPDPALASSTIRLISTSSGSDPMSGSTSSMVVTKFDDPTDGGDSDTSISFSAPDPRRASIYPELPEFALLTAAASSSTIFPGAFPSFSPPSPEMAPSPPSEPEPMPVLQPNPPAPTTSHVAASILEEMNRRMAMNGSSAALTSAVLERKPIAPATSTTFSDLLGNGATDTRFDKIHQAAFDQMDSIVNHYAARRQQPKKSMLGGTTPKRKSGAIGQGGRVRPSFAPGPSSAKRRSRASVAAVNAKRASALTGAAAGKKVPSVKVDSEVNKQKEKVEVEEVKDGKGKVVFELVDTSTTMGEVKAGSSSTTTVVSKPSEAAKKKLEQTKAQPKTRSSAARKSSGRTSIVGSNTVKAKPGGITSRFGFLKSSAKLVRSVWGAATGSSASKTNAAAPKAAAPPPAPVPVKTRPSNPTSNVQAKPRIFSGAGLTSTSMNQRTSQVTKKPLLPPTKEEQPPKKGGIFSRPINASTFAKAGSGAAPSGAKSPGSDASKLPVMSPTGSVGVKRAVSSIGMNSKTVGRSVSTSSFGGVKKSTFGFGSGSGGTARATNSIPIRATMVTAGSLRRAVSSVTGLNPPPLKPKRGSTLTAPTAASLARRSNSLAVAKPPAHQNGIKSPKVFSPIANTLIKLPSVPTGEVGGTPMKMPLEGVENIVVDIKPAQDQDDTMDSGKKGKGLDVVLVADDQTLDKLIDQTAAEFVDDAMMDDFGIQPSSSAQSSLSGRSIKSTGTSGSSIRSVSGRRPRISRSKVIAKLDQKRAEAEEAEHALGALGGHQAGPGGKKNALMVRRSAGVVIVGGTPGRKRDDREMRVVMSAKKAIRRSEVARRRTTSKPIEWGGVGDQMDVEA